MAKLPVLWLVKVPRRGLSVLKFNMDSVRFRKHQGALLMRVNRTDLRSLHDVIGIALKIEK